jgi:hypothetical protein
MSGMHQLVRGSGTAGRLEHGHYKLLVDRHELGDEGLQWQTTPDHRPVSQPVRTHPMCQGSITKGPGRAEP